MMRIATLDGIQPSALTELDEIMEKQFVGTAAGKTSSLGGPKVAAEILNLVDTSQNPRSWSRSTSRTMLSAPASRT